MTLLTKGRQSVYLAHPVKTAGSSITAALKMAGWAVDWYLQSPFHPAHWPASTYQSALTVRGIDATIFVLVRHPIARLGSYYRYRLAIGGDVPPTFERWVQHQMLTHDDAYISLRQVEYIPEVEHTVLRYEDGVGRNLRLIDPRARLGKRAAAGAPVPAEQMEMSESTRAQVCDYFAEDFSRLGYSR